jgi:GTPase SAR1 family protein
MFKSLQVCGTSGSGKTTLVRELINRMDDVHHMGETFQRAKMKKPKICRWYEGTYQDTKIIVLGDYNKTCGGCDTIPSVQIVADMLDHMNSVGVGICVFEGLMLSHMVGTVGAKQLEMGAENHWRAYLDTSLFTCLENVVARRRAAGNLKPLNTANTTADWPRVVNSRRKWEGQGGIAHTIQFDQAWQDFDHLLGALCHE